MRSVGQYFGWLLILLATVAAIFFATADISAFRYAGF